jgi:hypothetical protein
VPEAGETVAVRLKGVLAAVVDTEATSATAVGVATTLTGVEEALLAA